MSHEHGDVPGPTSKHGARPAHSARPGEHAAEPQASPPAPLGYGEAASENLGTMTTPPKPMAEKSAIPSDGRPVTQESTPHRGGGYLLIPGEDS